MIRYHEIELHIPRLPCEELGETFLIPAVNMNGSIVKTRELTKANVLAHSSCLRKVVKTLTSCVS